MQIERLKYGARAFPKDATSVGSIDEMLRG